MGRKPITIQLNTETDEDLVKAIAALPSGQRNSLLKAALRASLGLVQPLDQVDQVSSELAYLRQALDNMPDWLEARFTAMRAAIQNATIIQPGDMESAVEPLPTMTDEKKQRRMQNMDKVADW